MVIQVYALASNAEEAEVERIYEDLHWSHTVLPIKEASLSQTLMIPQSTQVLGMEISQTALLPWPESRLPGCPCGATASPKRPLSAQAFLGGAGPQGPSDCQFPSSLPPKVDP